MRVRGREGREGFKGGRREGGGERDLKREGGEGRGGRERERRGEM